jgi:hypothetical protein
VFKTIGGREREGRGMEGREKRIGEREI